MILVVCDCVGEDELHVIHECFGRSIFFSFNAFLESQVIESSVKQKQIDSHRSY